ncbi:hypothetical protein LAUMK191_05154 [Mycobacterium attenuatum]|nr:hypothetical protein LAUMK191_05154 [Mycobacterium attenuatum]
MRRQPARPFPDRGSPGSAVFAAQQCVVAVSGLSAHAGPPAGRGDGVQAATATARDSTAGGDDAGRQVGVLAIGAAKPLVEAADADQRVAAISHVGGDPACRCQPQGAAIVVGRPARPGCRHLDHRLGAHRARRVGDRQVGGQLRAPPRTGHDVVIQEAHPPGGGGAPSDVARGCRAAPTAGQHPHRKAAAHFQGGARVRPVVHHHHLRGRWPVSLGQRNS